MQNFVSDKGLMAEFTGVAKNGNKDQLSFDNGGSHPR